MIVLTKIARRCFLFSLNNILVNNLLIFIKQDHLIKTWVYNWRNIKFDESKTIQENVGCSSNPIIESLVKQSHQHLADFVNSNNIGGDILDIGCGAGLYLADFKPVNSLHGIDLNPDFLNKARKLIPHAKLYEGNFLETPFDTKFDFIYCFSMLMYIEPSQLENYFRTVAANLKPNGFFYLQYSHAVCSKDLFFPDLSVIKYSPKRIKHTASKHLEIMEHHHYYDGRILDKFDSTPYYFPNSVNRTDTLQNTSLLIGRKSKTDGGLLN